jgi:large subunit ribosomal protein L18
VSNQSRLKERRERRARRIKNSLELSRPRLSIFKSLNHMYGQIIDDNAGHTLVSCSTVELKDLTGDKKEKAFSVGEELAKKAQEKNIEYVVFDRGISLFHGRVKWLAEGATTGGLKFKTGK